jgi:hypothetical protein
MITVICDQCIQPIESGDEQARLALMTMAGLSLDFHNQEHMLTYLAGVNLDPPPAEDPPAEDPPSVDDAGDVPVPDENGTVYRDAVTGRYVTPEYAAANPDTTVAEAATP